MKISTVSQLSKKNLNILCYRNYKLNTYVPLRSTLRKSIRLKISKDFPNSPFDLDLADLDEGERLYSTANGDQLIISEEGFHDLVETFKLLLEESKTQEGEAYMFELESASFINNNSILWCLK